MTNPLLQRSTLHNYAPPFDQIEEDHFLPAVEAGIHEARQNIDAIKQNTEVPTFENTIAALESATETLDNATSVFYNELLANGTDGLQDLSEKIGPMNAAFSNDILLDPDLFARVKRLWEQQEHIELTIEQKTILEETYQGFMRAGAELDEEGQRRLREISQRMSVLGPAFMNNATKSAEAFEMVLDEQADLSGLPESIQEMARQMADERGYEGKWLFTLDFPSVMPFLQYADRQDLREKIWRGFANRAYGDQFDNCQQILEIVSLRDEKAKLLGFDTYAAYALDRKMAKTPEQVWSFLETLKANYKPAAENDLHQLQNFAKETDGLDELKPWDVAYYAEKLKHHLYHFSSEDVRPYFPLEKVLAGMFEHFSKLFGVHFEAAGSKYPVWHKDVQVFDVTDKHSGDFIGTFYADFFPRTGKKQGAWENTYRKQGLFNKQVERPIVVICCNFNKPTGSKPALLTHGEITILFHEMGHAMHDMLSNVTYQGMAGTSVKHDFVELPSQLQENWCFEKETLDLLSGHYETGEKIPQELVEKLIAAKNFMAGWFGLRQTNFGILDMAWHTANPAQIENVESFEDTATRETSLFPRLAGPFSTSFLHLFAGGYAAGYYSYKWAEVLEADAFELFLDKGLYNPDIAQSYRHNILAKGGTEDPNILFQRFRGREADSKALFRREELENNTKVA